MENMKQNLKSFKESRKALYHVLEDYLAGKPWSLQVSQLMDEYFFHVYELIQLILGNGST
jgi:hypothetical protein